MEEKEKWEQKWKIEAIFRDREGGAEKKFTRLESETAIKLTAVRRGGGDRKEQGLAEKTASAQGSRSCLIVLHETTKKVTRENDARLERAECNKLMEDLGGNSPIGREKIKSLLEKDKKGNGEGGEKTKREKAARQSFKFDHYGQLRGATVKKLRRGRAEGEGRKPDHVGKKIESFRGKESRP